MDAKNAALAYRQASFENAPPIKIVRMLYDGAIRYIDRAESMLVAGGQPAWATWIARADAIVEELALALDPAHDPAQCAELTRLYLFVQERLARAVQEKDPERLREARRVLVTLSEGWARVELEARQAG